MDNPMLCSHCLSPNAPLECVCKGALFCNVSCQQAGWASHRLSCTVELGRRLKDTKRELGAEHVDVASARIRIADLQRRQGRFEDAERGYLEALRIYKKAGTENGEAEARAVALNRLGITYDEMGRYDEALQVLRESDKLIRWALGEDHVQLGEVLNAKGNIALSLGDLAKALHCFDEAMSIYCASFGIESEQVARVLNNQGTAYIELCQWDRAREALEHALRIQRKLVRTARAKKGNERQAIESADSVGITMLNIGIVLSEKGQYNASLQRYDGALAIFRQSHGEKHPAVATALENIGVVLKRQGKHPEALKALRKALRIQRRTLSDDNQESASVLSNMGSVQLEAGKCQDALQLFDKALRVYKSCFGSEHDRVAQTQYDRAMCKDKLGDRAGALECAKDAHRIYTIIKASKTSANDATLLLHKLETGGRTPRRAPS